EIALLGELEGGSRYSGGQEFDCLKRLQEDLEAFGNAINKKEEWEGSAKRVDEWYDRIDEGVRRFMHEWVKNEGDFKDTRRLKRERNAAEGQAFAKRGKIDGGDKREEKHGGTNGGKGPPRSRVHTI
ncbi:unnamed protein product, partial [Pylaiella littoralis]